MILFGWGLHTHLPAAAAVAGGCDAGCTEYMECFLV
jgi:hypothetical protein